MNQQPKEFCKLEDYIKTEKIGSGSYGVVFKGIHKKTGEIVAMKKVHSSDENGITHTTIREISLLRDLKPANLLINSTGCIKVRDTKWISMHLI